MALVVKDRVKETSATTGTGTLTLAGAVTGFQSFSSALSDGDTTYYAIFESSTGAWEVGLGTFTASGTTLARTTILASSNSGSAVNLTAGVADVFITQPAGKAAYFDGSGDLILNQDPTSALQAATKQYVDTIAAAGIHYHTPVRVESPSNLTATYDNGTAGVGATLTNSGTQAALVIDGITLSTSDRVLVYNQTNAAHNGIYTVTNTGSVSTNWVLTRATDADSYGPSDPDALGEGDAFFVSEGNTGAGELYVMNTSGTITFGTTNITFAIIAETAVYSAGNGLTLTGTTFAVGAGTGVTVNANDVAIGQSVGTGDTVTFATVNANLTGNVTGNVSGSSGSTTGNAATATALQTGRTISLTGDVTGTSGTFDGTGNVSIAATIAANAVALGTDTTGNYVATGAVSGNGLSGSASAEGATFTVTSNATTANTASTIVFRDASGNFSAGTITAALNGNASTATTANGVAANSVALGADTTGNYVQQGATSGNGISGSVNSEGGTFTVTSNATSANTASTIVFRDGSGNFSAGTITANLTGTASFATNAGTLDSLDSTQFLRSDANDTATGLITIDRIGEALGIGDSSLDSADAYIRIGNGSLDWRLKYVGSTSGTGGNEFRIESSNTGDYLQFDHDGNFERYDGVSTFTIWDSGNDGSGSGLDADLWDGNQFSSYLNQAVLTTSSPSFAGLNINGALNAVDNIYLADTLYHEGDTNTYLNFQTDEIRLAVGGSQEVTITPTGVQLGDTGNGYFQPVSGDFGSIQIDGGAHGGYEGYSIGGIAAFMTDSTASMGLYNDANNQWVVRGTLNGTSELYYAGGSKLNTTSTGVNVTGTAEVDTLQFSDGSTQTSAGASTGKAIAMAIVFG